jgi:hypothetical protein
MLVLFLIIGGIALRFVPHAPNFTPIAAIALFSGAYLKKRHAILLPLLIMVISDLAFGIHDLVLFTWGGFVLTSILGFWLKRHKNVVGVVSASFGSSILFYLITNFGVWLMGWYPPTLSGLMTSYIMAIPFLRNFMAATVLYTTVMVGTCELVALKVKGRKLAKVLL